MSTGGPRALVNMLPVLCDAVGDLPIFIVQHMPPTFTASLAKTLDKRCSSHTVIEASHSKAIRERHVYIAPGGRHMLLRSNPNGQPLTILNDRPHENGCRPSVDVLFRSAAAVWGGQAVSIILTGMGVDGTQGVAPLKRAGAKVIVQDEATSVVWGMPGSAYAPGNVDQMLPLMEIPEAVRKVIEKNMEPKKKQ